MALVVEDGTGKIDANSYASEVEADAYFADRDDTVWDALTSAVKEQSLILATDYIETRFELKFKGKKEFPDVPQALSFPRLSLLDREGKAVEGVPTKLKRATFEYAVRSSASVLLPDPTVDAIGGNITSLKEKVGPIETETEYSEGTHLGTSFKPYPAADKLLTEYIISSSGVIRG